MALDDPEKIANASLHQRAALMAENGVLRDALTDIEELVEDRADVDDGRGNLAMQILVILRAALSRKQDL